MSEPVCHLERQLKIGVFQVLPCHFSAVVQNSQNSDKTDKPCRPAIKEVASQCRERRSHHKTQHDPEVVHGFVPLCGALLEDKVAVSSGEHFAIVPRGNHHGVGVGLNLTVVKGRHDDPSSEGQNHNAQKTQV